MIDVWDPVIASPRVYRQAALLERTVASPAVAKAYIEAALRTDVSRVAPQVQCPVRVLHMPTNTLPEAVSRHAAELFPASELHLLRPSEPGMSFGETFVPVWEHNVELVTGRAAPPSDRRMATVMFEDVVGSTKLISEIGDDAWGRLSVQRDRLVRDRVEHHGGQVVHTAGDGSMCTLPGPAAAIRCAEQLHEVVRTLELDLRVGIHTGACERIGDDLVGMAVHVAARIGAAAAPGETLVSRTVSDLVASAGGNFATRGIHELKGSARRLGAARGHRQHTRAERAGAAAQAAPERPAHCHRGAADAARPYRRQPPGLSSLASGSLRGIARAGCGGRSTAEARDQVRTKCVWSRLAERGEVA